MLPRRTFGVLVIGAVSVGVLSAGGPSAIATTSAGATLKPAMSGLITRGGVPPTAYANAVKGRVVDTTWAKLQPRPGGPIVHPNPIDDAIASARKRGLSLKLRIRAGIDAPSWAKSLDGPPVEMHDIYNGHSQTIGRFWTPRFAAAYADLQRKLAAAYDNVPQIRETAIGECGMQYAETYLRDAMDKRNAAALRQAGFTLAGDAFCHMAQLVAHKVWVHTRSDLALNPYQALQPDGKVRSDDAVTYQAMKDCHAVLGTRCVLENNSIRSRFAANDITDHYAKMYAEMRAMGGVRTFQTATVSRIGNWQVTLGWAAQQGAASVELPAGYTRWPVSQLQHYATLLAAK